MTEGRVSDDVSRLYAGGSYASPSSRVDRLLEPLRRVGDRATLTAVGAVRSGTRVLDLGAGDGRMLTVLRRRGCVVSGVDPFASGTDESLAIRRVALENAVIEPESADVVLLWHVLEHVDDPAAAVDVAGRALRSGGRLVVSVPSLDSLQARLGGDRWFHLDVPRHAVHFTRAGLVKLLERCGLRPMAARGAAIDQNLLGMTQTLLNRLTSERNVAFRALKGDDGLPRRDLALTVAAAIPVAVAGSVAELAAALFGRSGALVVHGVRSVS